MSIENRNLAVGTRLWANYKKQRYVCMVEAAESGDGLIFALEGGKRHKSPSSAGMEVMGGKAANGWRFWTVEGDAPVTATSATRSPTKADSAAEAEKAGRKPKARAKAPLKMIRPHENQDDVPEGQVRYWCAGCLDVFLGFAGEAPQQCPNGHRIDDPEMTAAPSTEEAATE